MSEIKKLLSLTKSKELNLAEREKYDYYSKLQVMNNRLKNIKQKQSEVNSKISKMKNIEKHHEDFQTFRERNKLELKKMRSKTNKLLKTKKQMILQEKKFRCESMQRSIILNKEKKQKELEERKADKEFTVLMLTQYNQHKINLNKCKVAKEKLNQVNFQTQMERKRQSTKVKMRKIYQRKINLEKKETNKLKSQLKQLEKFEEECLNQLNKTMKYKNEMVKNFNKRTFYPSENKNNKNNLLVKSNSVKFYTPKHLDKPKRMINQSKIQENRFNFSMD